MLSNWRPSVPSFSVFVHAHLVRIAGCQAPEQAADQQHDLAIGVVVAVAEWHFDILVPPLGPVPYPAVTQQVFFQLGEARPQVADLHADRVAVQRGLLLGRRCARTRACVRLGEVRPGRVPLEDVI